MTYIRHDINNNPVSPQPGVSTVSDLGGISGWSTVTYQNYNLDFIARTYNGLSVREVNSFTPRNIDNTAREPEDYIRHDDTNFPKPKLDLRFALNKSLTDHISGNNLITFSRASSGTFVDSDGLIRTTPVNKLLHSEDFSQNAWIKSNVSSITTGQLAPDNTNTAAKLALPNANNWFIYQDAGSVVGQPYIGHVYLKGSANATLGLRKPGQANTTIGSSGTLSISVTTEWQKFEAFTTSAENTDGRLLIDGRSVNGAYVPDGFELFIWHPQVEDGTTANPYIKTGSTISGAPRFDHDPATGESLGLLIEESRTNLFTYSNFPQSTPTSTPTGWLGWNPATFLTSQTLSPDGVSFGLFHGSLNQNGGGIRKDLTGLTAGGSYYLTAWVKGLTSEELTYFTNNNAIGTKTGTASGAQDVPWFAATKVKIAIGNLSGSGASGNTQITLTQEWQKLEAAITVDNAGSVRIIINNDVSDTGTGNQDGGGTFLIWGAQLEEGAFPSSYIPTTNSTVTRPPDDAQITGTNFTSFYNESNGTAFIQISTKGESNSLPFQTYFAFNSDGGNRWGICHRRSASDVIAYVGQSGNFETFSYGSFAVNQSMSIVMHQPNGSSIQGVKDGGSFQSVNTAKNPNFINNLSIGKQISDNSNLNGHIKRLTYMPYRLPGTILQSMTS